MDEPKIIDFGKIEKKWQKKWEKEKIFCTQGVPSASGKVSEDSKKEKFYVLEMYPYPSAAGLHMGHALNYTIGDIYARYKRMSGFNVLYPMGFDSFGLPAENAAVKNKSHPKKFTEDAIANYIRQLKELGLSYDWSRMVETHKPNYYRWDQWTFLKMFEKDLAYRKKAPVNWCSECGGVLANEQVHNGKCWVHKDTNVEVKHLEQWFLKTTEYAEELNDFSKLDGWPDLIKKSQKNWIGKSYGFEIGFEIDGESWPIFTTRPDTLYGVTFMVVAAQHPRLSELVTKEQKKEVDKFLKKVNSVSEKAQEKLATPKGVPPGDEDGGKEGAFTGSYAVNPATGDKVPVYAGNFVVAEYGCGMVMAVPAHDQRDFEFAKKYDIPVKVVINPDDYDLNAKKMSRAFTGHGKIVNSGKFDDLLSQDAISEIGEKFGNKVVNYKLRDWLVSRQRFWGTPIPMIYCDKCGIVPVPEKDLPVVLPEDVKFSGKKNPLVGNKDFTEVKCPKCGGNGRRETDTMDTFVNSSWYFMRYCDSKNNKKIFDSKKVKYWCPVDMYIGGKEHANMHLIYSRFYTKFLRDLGLIDFDEPSVKLFNQGMLHGEDGEKMSKSRGNVILPETVSKKYGIDTARLFLVSVASPDKDTQWDEKGIEGSLRFVKRVLDYCSNFKSGRPDARVEHKMNKAIKEISSDIEGMKYNLAVIKLRNLFDVVESSSVGKKDLEKFVKMLSVFCPHVGEEIWSKIGGGGFISLANWPVVDEKKIDENIDKTEQAVEKTVGDIMNILKIVPEGKKVYVYILPPEKNFYSEEELSKRVGKSVKVFVVNDKDKYDPKDFARKAKMGRPAIFVE